MPSSVQPGGNTWCPPVCGAEKAADANQGRPCAAGWIRSTAMPAAFAGDPEVSMIRDGQMSPSERMVAAMASSATVGPPRRRIRVEAIWAGAWQRHRDVQAAVGPNRKFGRGRPVRAAAPTGVQGHRLPEPEQELGAGEHLGVDRTGVLGGVQARPMVGRRRAKRIEARKFLADPIAAEHDVAQRVADQTGQGGFPGAGQPADQHQPDRTRAEVTSGDANELPRGRAGGWVTLRRVLGDHLGPRECPIGDVVMHQGGRGGVAGEFAVPTKQSAGERRRTESFQIHCQKSDVVDPVDMAQPVVVIQAVQDPRSVVQAGRCRRPIDRPCPSRIRFSSTRRLNSGSRPARNCAESSATAFRSASARGPPSKRRASSRLAFHRSCRASRLPCAATSGPRPHCSWKTAIRRAIDCTSESTMAPERTLVDSRRSAGIRAISTAGSPSAPCGAGSVPTPR